MKLIKQSYKILEQEIPVRKLDDYSGSHFREQYMENMFKHIEKCGKVCYKSEHTIKEGSAAKFVQRLIDSGHTSVLEHGVVYLKFPSQKVIDRGPYPLYSKYQQNQYSKCIGFGSSDLTDSSIYYYVTTTYRVIIDNGWEDDLQYLCEPTEYHEKRHTVLLHSCIHVYKDLTRHRKASFSIESTRYCNYAKDKFGGELKFVIPSWCKYISPGDAYWYDGICYRTGATEKNQFMGDRSWNHPKKEDNRLEWSAELNLLHSLDRVQNDYNKFIKVYGWQPQQAAEILPQCTAADIVMTAFEDDWKYIFLLRSKIAATGKPHPLVEELMTPLMEEFIDKGCISDIIPNSIK